MKLSVIVCTFNRSHAIIKCLDSIAHFLAAAAPVEAEIVVVDNASTDDTADVIKKWAATCAFPVQALYEPKKGVSTARNLAIRKARGQLLSFTDDDCCLSKSHVSDALRHDAADTGPVLRGGRVELGDQTDLQMTIKTDQQSMRMSRKMNSARHDNVAGIVIGCNLVMRRTVADTIGFFDEELGPGTGIPAAEDTDFLFRAYLADVVLEYVPDMTVYHFHGRKTKLACYNLLQNYMIGTGALYVKYLFKNIDFCRPYYWDFKQAIEEIISGKMGCRPEFGFSYKIKVYYCTLGALKYCILKMRNMAS